MRIRLIIIILLSTFSCIAQKIIPFYDSVNKFHISYPENWNTAYKLDGNEGLSSYKGITEIYGEKMVIEKIMVEKDKETSITLLSELGLVNKYYSNSIGLSPTGSIGLPSRGNLKYIVNNFQHLAFDKSAAISLVDIKFFICHNTDVFIFIGSCRAKDFDTYRKLYIDVVNSIYFD